MKIVKYEKVGKDKYKVFLENKDSIILFEDIILKYELLLNRQIENIELIKEENSKYEIYNKVLGFISKRIRCESEINEYLKKYTSNQEFIDNIIEKLYNQKLINHELYIKSYLHDKMNFTNDGPLKIKKNLEKLGLNSYLIEDMLIEYNQEKQLDKINSYINKNLKSNTKSLNAFKQKMLINLINLGYYKEDIMECLTNLTYLQILN